MLARAAFEKAVHADEKNAEAWAWLGEAKQHTDQNGSAELDQALKLNSKSPTVRGLRGLYLPTCWQFPSGLDRIPGRGTRGAGEPSLAGIDRRILCQAWEI